MPNLMHALKRFVASAVAANPFLTARQLQQMCATSTSLRPSESSVYRALHALSLTYKSAFRQVARTHDGQAILDFCKRFDDAWKSKTLVALDEMGVHMGMRPRKGWAPAGCRLVAASSSMRHAKLTVVMAVSRTAIVGSQTSRNNMNKERFMQFMKDLDVPSGTTVLMDNIAFHKSKEVVQLMRERGIHPLYTLPYSPATNPIENLFSVIKQDLRRHCNGTEDADVVKECILCASRRAEKHNNACFQKVHAMVSRCLEAQDPTHFCSYDGATHK